MGSVSIPADTASTVGPRLRRFLERPVVASSAAMNVLPALLSPAAVVALVLGLWRVSADLGWTEEFLISNGFFSHWQVSIVLAIALPAAAATLGAKIPSEHNISSSN